jgi:hypothetical protein
MWNVIVNVFINAIVTVIINVDNDRYYAGLFLICLNRNNWIVNKLNH